MVKVRKGGKTHWSLGGAKESVQTRKRGNLIDMDKEVMSHTHGSAKGRRVKEESWLA